MGLKSLDILVQHELSKVPKPVWYGTAVAGLAELCLTIVPLYYSISQPVLTGTKQVKSQILEYVANNAFYFIPGFLFGAALSHNSRTKTDSSSFEKVYNFIFDHPQVAALPTAFAFYNTYNSYKMLQLEPQHIISGVAYSGDLFRSLIAGMTAYTAITVLASVLHTQSLKFFKNALSSRFKELLQDFDGAAEYQKKVADLDSLFSSRNHQRLARLYLKNGKILEAIDEYARALKPSKGTVPSDILAFPLYLLSHVMPDIKPKEYTTRRDDITEKIGQAVMSFSRGNIKEANQFFIEAIEIDPMQGNTHVIYSHFLYGIGNDEEADRHQHIANKVLFSSDQFNVLERIKGSRNVVYIETIRA